MGDALPDFSAYHPFYFNSGCCCFSDGDITGLEISEGFIRLVKWEYNKAGVSVKIVLEETRFDKLFDKPPISEF